MSNKTNFDYIIYHSNCSDGIGSAWTGTLVNNTCILIECVAGKNPDIDIECFRNKSLLFCDISPLPEYVEELLKNGSRVVVIDHHVTALNNIEKFKNDITIIKSDDTSKSGCILTWDYFFTEPAPWFLHYISDRDTWNWKLINSKEINTALFEDGHITFEGLTNLYNSYTDLNHFINRGKVIEEFRNKIINKFMKTAIPVKYKDYYVWLYSCLSDYKSDVGNQLLNKEMVSVSNIRENNLIKPDFTVAYHYNITSNEYWLSLRSNDFGPDVCKIAKEISNTGGGHRNASGVTIDYDVFNKIFIPL